jgi:type I restriction enzyme R subunit
MYDNLADLSPPDIREPLGQHGDEGLASSREAWALALDHAIRRVKKADWRGNRFKEREVRNAVTEVLGDDDALVDQFFEIVKAQRDY